MKSPQLDLFATDSSPLNTESSLAWPDPRRFPLNQNKINVAGTVLADLTNGDNPLIVTGYASLDQVIDFLSRYAQQRSGKVLRVVLGSEPFEARARHAGALGTQHSDEIRDYWLEKGISLLHSAKIITAIEMIKGGRLQCRKAGDNRRKLHAKIYCSTEAATLGSSNFTRNGLYWQMECNARFSQASDKRRHREACDVAENFWSIGEDYSERLVELLSDLLKVVSWQEALARACSELLEGQWAKHYIEQHIDLGDTKLWPSQEQGIAQALWILENVGSVLVADPTGSGKTRMGAHLLRALGDRTWSRGRAHIHGRRDLSVLICPPAVAPHWRKEAIECGLPLQIHSHGVLSRSGSDSHEGTVAMVRRAQILSVDESHNFLNLTSNRARQVMGNLADHVVLFTATPINKGPSDLISLVEMLGADNMEDQTLKVLEGLSRRRSVSESTMSRTEINGLRKEIQRFTVRRTKSFLNLMVDQSPHLYIDHRGKKCRYPKHSPQLYDTGETVLDKRLALEIRKLAQNLKGVALLEKEMELPEALRREGWSEEAYLVGRLQAIKSLSAYNIMSRLRSSKAALYEHLLGTAQTTSLLGLSEGVKKAGTGNMIQKLGDKVAAELPLIKLSCELPDWLTTKEAFEKACVEDIKTLQNILTCLEKMSFAREIAKAKKLAELSKSHELILAFDSHLISLEVIRIELQKLQPDHPVFIATGSNDTGKKEVMKQFSRDAKGRGIALCSDSMSEGLNLQGASAIMHLDMPSVVRVAEQRVGRVDRMDSPHDVMQAWWPNDSAEFALRADERFLERYLTVDTLLGSNMPLPSSFGPTNASESLTAQNMIGMASMAEADPWDGIKDAFSPVQELIQGSKSIIPHEIYKIYRDVSAQLLSRVSLVKARKPWAFFCIKGVQGGPPKWVLIIDGVSKPYTSLDEVCLRLRPLLEGGVEDLPMTHLANDTLSRFLIRLKSLEVELLPRKKQRALWQMQTVLGHYRDRAVKQGEQQLALRWGELVNATKEQTEMQVIDERDGLTMDMEVLAEQWLNLIRPHWHALLSRRRKRRAPLTLKDLNKDLITTPLELDAIEKTFSGIPTVQPIDRRIAACIVGVV